MKRSFQKVYDHLSGKPLRIASPDDFESIVRTQPTMRKCIEQDDRGNGTWVDVFLDIVTGRLVYID